MSFPISLATPIRFPGPLPAAADVVVLGGGIIGVMTALYLAQAGQKVVLCEKGRIAAEQSSRNWGWIRQQGRDKDELPIVVESLRLWQGFAQTFGDALGFSQAGVIYLANTDAALEEYEAFLPHAQANGVDTRMLARCEIATMLGSSAAWRGAMMTPSDARAEPWAAVPLLAGLAAEAGVCIVEHCAIRALDVQAGAVAGVITEQGRVRAARVVVAAGAWSRLFLAAHGVAIPQLSVLASVAQTEPMPQIFAGGATDSHFAFRRRMDGGYTLAPGGEHDFFIGPDAFRSFAHYLPVLKKDFRSTHFRAMAPKGYPDAWRTPRRWGDGASPFEATRILNPAPNMASLGQVQDRFAAAFPTLGRPKIKSAWAGMIDTMPDVVPVVDHAAISGLTIATGMSGHGFGIGPGMGRVVADLVMGRATGHDLTRFRLSRFSDGTAPQVGPALA
ncbi:MAG: FAD-binding oxidoreductase [Pseudotabrizicola sp.]|uniref:NAD(P)/FAD-dependent oxidoreductase n=1 Tax=Pseudotabrizicola sp. TaxID=2939647 RepID=UPI00272F0C08|nr:FAD-binding oxidoreductase [Pseudotabrizicola sp.]MDP2079808.1 FAD-binding oxidoreductase [Pseudotabrizicola sp.]MDZ7574809.1 FAD-binding oxidoreductase [Pseudotabrizicola sp.]